jgi:hypothetical protein
MRAWLEMDRILAVIPWPIWVLAVLVVAALVVARNSFRLRKKLGKTTTPEEIRKIYPRAKIITWRSKKSDPDSN